MAARPSWSYFKRLAKEVVKADSWEQETTIWKVDHMNGSHSNRYMT